MTAIFENVLVPLDGSAPSLTALDYGLALARAGAHLRVVHVVDESRLVAETAAAETGFDPTNLLNALEEQARAIIGLATLRSRAAGVESAAEIVHAHPVWAILDASKRSGCDLIVMGTHARSGLTRAFLGSTTEGVLRMSETPVLTVRAGIGKGEDELFRRAVVAVDDSAPAEAALGLAARLAISMNTEVVVGHAIDTRHLHDMAAQYGYDPKPILDDWYADARTLIKPLLLKVGLATSTEPTIVEGNPASAILQLAQDQKADVIVVGSHGRSGLARLILGSVAEGVVRRSPIPVLVVRR